MTLPKGPLRTLLQAELDAHDALVTRYGFTHTGSTPGNDARLLWGLTHPNPALHIFIPGSGQTEFLPCDREVWQQLTDQCPPWPWLPDGTGPDYEATWR